MLLVTTALTCMSGKSRFSKSRFVGAVNSHCTCNDAMIKWNLCQPCTNMDRLWHILGHSCRFSLGAGDLLVMKGRTQKQWQHTGDCSQRFTLLALTHPLISAEKRCILSALVEAYVGQLHACVHE